MRNLTESGGFSLTNAERTEIASTFDADRASEDETLATIRDLASSTGYVADPHTAVGLAAARRLGRTRGIPVVTLATAHPAKFPDAMRRALDMLPAEPTSLARQRDCPERMTILPNDAGTVARHIAAHARTARG